MSWIGQAITTGVDLLGGLISNNSSKKNAERAIRAQQEENQKNRDYNLMLAQQQNAWNVEQWERENEYNTPANQMARMKEAGINPDLAVGGGAQSLSAASPQMTAGAPSTPADMSALGQVPTLGQAIQSAMRSSLLGAQIDNIRADTQRKRLDNDVQIELKNFLGLEFKDASSVNNYLFSPQAQKYIMELRQMEENLLSSQVKNQNESMDQIVRELNFDMEKKVSQKEWESLSAHFDKTIK